jgi:hypothetical protein
MLYEERKRERKRDRLGGGGGSVDNLTPFSPYIASY